MQDITFLPKKGGVYAIECAATGELYIGQTRGIRERVAGHFRQLKKGIHPNRSIQTSHDRYGMDSLAAYVIEHCQEGRIRRDREFYWVQKLRPAMNGASSTENRNALGARSYQGRQRLAARLRTIYCLSL